MKRSKLIVIIFSILLVISISNVSLGFDNIWNVGKEWLNRDITDPELNTENGYSTMEEAVNILWGIGIFVILIGGVALGIRYMTAGGIERKAEIKKETLPYVVGAIIIIGALTIWKLSITFLEGLE